MTNYICINGKKAELTEEQMKALGIELPKVNPFERVKKEDGVDVYFINSMGYIQKAWDTHNFLYEVGNYCTDKAIMEQRALHETLNRLLWRYSMEHDGDKVNWETTEDKWSIAYDENYKDFKAYVFNSYHYIGAIYFNTKEIAEAAIKTIIKPFMKAHPDFKW